MDLKHLPLLLGTVLYFAQCLAFAWTRDWWASLVFFAYCLANIGLIAKF